VDQHQEWTGHSQGQRAFCAEDPSSLPFQAVLSSLQLTLVHLHQPQPRGSSYQLRCCFHCLHYPHLAIGLHPTSLHRSHHAFSLRPPQLLAYLLHLMLHHLPLLLLHRQLLYLLAFRLSLQLLYLLFLSLSKA
jgi:hypothetical protein